MRTLFNKLGLEPLMKKVEKKFSQAFQGFVQAHNEALQTMMYKPQPAKVAVVAQSNKGRHP